MSKIVMTAAAALALALGTAQAQQAPSSSPQPQRPGAAAGPGAQKMPGWRHGPGADMPMMMRGRYDDDDRCHEHGMGGGARHGMMRPHMMLMMMALVDTDGSGALSLDEVQAVHARLFKYADTDSDGELTPEEIRAFMFGNPEVEKQTQQ